MARDKVYMPSGSGGLVRYGEAGDEKVKVKPKQVAIIVAGLVAFEVALKVIFMFI